MPRALSAMKVAGGFVWWYMDMVDEQGNGAVLIWSFGLPFLPGYTSSAREGNAAPAEKVPSLNVVVYERGEVAFYLLQTYAPEACSWEAERHRWVFGDSEIVQEDNEVGGRRVTVRLNCTVPHVPHRLVGTCTVEGQLRQGGTWMGPHDAGHDWSPVLAVGKARLDLRCGDRNWRFDGLAYHDRNASPVHIDGLGIRDWTWGRFCDGETTWIYYLVNPSDPFRKPTWLGLEITRDGRTRTLQLDAQFRRRRWDRFGMRYASALELSMDGRPWMTVSQARVVDRGFFYLRLASSCTLADGRTLDGVSEVVAPARVDLARHRWLVSMAVHRTEAPNSMWLPLFSGPVEGRWRRLFWTPARALLGGNAPAALEDLRDSSGGAA
jgi:carotenoid 1,2-hydratase